MLYPAELYRQTPILGLKSRFFSLRTGNRLFYFSLIFISYSLTKFCKTDTIYNAFFSSFFLSLLHRSQCQSDSITFFTFSLRAKPNLCLRRRVLYPAELRRHMPQTLDFTGFLRFFSSAIYKIINSFSSCQSTDFFDSVTSERSQNLEMLCYHLWHFFSSALLYHICQYFSTQKQRFFSDVFSQNIRRFFQALAATVQITKHLCQHISN